MPTYDLAIICASNRPQLTPILVQQILRQNHAIKLQAVIVQEHEFKVPEITGNNCNISYYRKPQQGNAGAYARDFGIALADSEYVCFWDDDNWYYEHAVQSVWEATTGYDIGIVRTEHHTPKYSITIPRTKHWLKPTFGDVDTMCFSVRTTLAKMHAWSQFKMPGTDFQWLTHLLTQNVSVNYSHACIGKLFHCRQL